MLEYTFFENAPRARFMTFLAEQGLSWTLEHRDPETLVVVDEAQLDDDLAERLESFYDELFDLEQGLFETRHVPQREDHAVDGLALRLADGRTLRADLPAELVDRVLTVLSREELTTLAQALVDALEGSDRHPFHPRDGEAI
jgi:hypothetical protein